MKHKKKWIWAGLAVVVLGAILFSLPPVQERVWYRLDQLRIRVQYALRPPEEAVFTPDARVAQVVQATLTQMALVASPTATRTPAATATPLAPDAPTATATPTATPLPLTGLIDNVPYVDQHYGFNNCAPANLTMALDFWGWNGSREDVSAYVKPFAKDKNVMPYELVDFANTQTGLRALERVGASLDTLKALVSGGFPVIVERGVYLRDLSGKISWMGHYQVVYGYDDAKTQFQVKDSFEQNGARFTVTYADLIKGWRSFNYQIVVVYPPEQEGEVLALLGPLADETQAAQTAAQTASEEIYQTEGQDQFFAWYNRGSSLVKLQDFTGAAQAYDEAFTLYAGLPSADRPWRAVWYQTGPYYAYFFTGRYYDVIGLADKTIDAASEPYLEESFFWRARAKAALGDTAGAVDDLRKSLEYHPDFTPSVALLQQLGVSP